MPIEGMTEQDLALLNPAERAIMEADDGDDDLDPADPSDGDEVKPAPAVKTDTALKADTPADEVNDDALVFTAKTPADAAAQRTALETRKNESFAKLMAGEIDPEEYQKVESEVSASMEKLLQATITDAVTNEISQAQRNKAWAAEVDSAIKSAVNDGINYRSDENLLKEFDQLIRSFSLRAEMAGMDDTGMKASKWALNEAHETMKLRHPDLVRIDPNAATGKAVPRAKADLGTIPPNLRGAPVAATASVGGEFAHMEGLTGADSEKAFARLTKEQQERWLDT